MKIVYFFIHTRGILSLLREIFHYRSRVFIPYHEPILRHGLGPSGVAKRELCQENVNQVRKHVLLMISPELIHATLEAIRYNTSDSAWHLRDVSAGRRGRKKKKKKTKMRGERISVME